MLISSLIFVGAVAMAQKSNDPLLSDAQKRKCENSAFQKNADIPAEQKGSNLSNCYELERMRTRLKTASEQQDRVMTRVTTGKCLEGKTLTSGGFLGRDVRREVTEKDIEECRQWVVDQQAQDKEVQKAMAAYADRIKAEQAAFDAKWGAVLSGAEKDRRVMDAVQIDYNSMQISILELLRQSDKGVAHMEKLATALDNSTMGLYLRDRMAAVLSSRSMCEAVNSCVGGKPASIKGSDLNAAFSGKVSTSAQDVKLVDPGTKPAAKPGTSK